MNTIHQETKVQLFLIGGNSWELRDTKGNVLRDCNDDYLIYMKNVNLKKGSLIEGRYLGELKPDSPILDDKCKDITFDKDGFYVDGKIVRTARLLAVNNKTKVIMIISND